MKSIFKRRDFLKKVSCMGVGGAFFLCCPLKMKGNGAAQSEQKGKKKLDLDKLTYCAYQCTEACELYKATVTNDEKLKKKVFTTWKWKEKFKLTYDPKIVFCHGCKTKDKPMNVVLKKCTVRKCAMEKKLASCIQCPELKVCKKELWIQYPQHRDYVLKLKKKYT